MYMRGDLMEAMNISAVRKNLFKLVDEVENTHDPIHIIGKRTNAVLISESDWSAIQETLYLLSIPGMRESIIEGMNTPLDECSEELQW